MGVVRHIGGGRLRAPSITVALIAHDSKKESLARFMAAHHRVAHQLRFIVPEDTARALDDPSLTLDVQAPDVQGGDLQVAAAIVEGRVDAAIFLHDPLAALPGEPEVGNFLKVCDLQPIPLATNLAAAEVLMHHLEWAVDRADRAREVDDDDEVLVERVLMLAGRRSSGDEDASHR